MDANSPESLLLQEAQALLDLGFYISAQHVVREGFIEIFPPRSSWEYPDPCRLIQIPGLQRKIHLQFFFNETTYL
jgi:hypothetical protein